MIKEITSAVNETIKQVLELKTAQGRQRQQRFIVEGFHLLEMALHAGIVVTIIALEPQKNLLENIDQIIVPPSLLKKLSAQVTPQGVLAICRMLPEAPLRGQRVAYLEGINDPGNLGTIIRSAAAFDLDLLIVSPDSVSLYNPKVLAASQGAIFTLPIKEGNMNDLITLKEQGYALIGTVLSSKALPLNKFAYPERFVIAFGSEDHGLSADIRRLLDTEVTIPMASIESLNVAMAASIVFYDMKFR